MKTRNTWTSVGIWDPISAELSIVEFPVERNRINNNVDMILPGTWIGSGLIVKLFNWIGSVLGPQFLHDNLKPDDFYSNKKENHWFIDQLLKHTINLPWKPMYLLLKRIRKYR